MKAIYYDSMKSYDTRSEEDLDCSGDDSGSSDCWEQWVNIWIPTISCVLFVVLLIIMYVIKPKVPDRPDRPDVEDIVDDDQKSSTDPEFQLTEVLPHTSQSEEATPVVVQPASGALVTQLSVLSETESVVSRL